MIQRRRLLDNTLVAYSALLGLSILGCASLYGLRVLISGRVYYLYLLQNIILAFVPYLIATAAALATSRLDRGRPGYRRIQVALAAPAALLWLLFYPNAPYIFTDFIHVINKVYLRVAPSEWVGLNALVWYDIVMNAAFAFIGHFIGLVSMWIMQAVMAQAFGRAMSRVFVGLAILLAGFGIYLGRFSRLNSWDAIFTPFRVAGEVVDALSDPMAAFFSFAFALFIFLSYGALASFKRISLPGNGTGGRADGQEPTGPR
jgi:uncharacterized membrane protein